MFVRTGGPWLQINYGWLESWWYESASQRDRYEWKVVCAGVEMELAWMRRVRARVMVWSRAGHRRGFAESPSLEGQGLGGGRHVPPRVFHVQVEAKDIGPSSTQFSTCAFGEVRVQYECMAVMMVLDTGRNG